MTPFYNVIFRACDKVESVHKAKRPFGLNKKQIIKVCFFSIYKSISKFNARFVVIGDELSDEILNFFKLFKNVEVINEKFGDASGSLIKQLDIARTIPDDQWVYLCEDDYLHSPSCFEYVSEFIINSRNYVQTSHKKKNYLNYMIGNLEKVPIIIHTADYPDRYEPAWKRPSYIFLSRFCHWRQITNTTHTVLLQSKTFKKFEKDFRLSAIGPSDSKLSQKIYGRFNFKGKSLCLSPIHGLSTHMTEGVMTPLVDWESIHSDLIEEIKAQGEWFD